MLTFLKSVADYFFGGTPTRVTMVHPVKGILQNAVTHDGKVAKFSDGVTAEIPDDAILVAHDEPFEPDPKKIKIHEK